MSKAKAVLYLSTLTPEQKVNLMVVVINALTNHDTTFPTPSPTLAQLTAAKNNLNTRLTTIETMEDNLEAERTEAKAAEAQADVLLTQTAGYVEHIAKGDASVIQLSGFAVVGAKTPIGPLPPPANLVGQATDIEGQAKLKWKKVRGAKSYIVECSQDPNGPWTQVTVTPRANCFANGLTSGRKYWFRVRAVGAAGMSGWSDPTMKMVA